MSASRAIVSVPHSLPAARLKVGELARATGLSVRTLHHYDAIGLLTPSGRTAAGHRLYSADDVQRLQQVQSLKAIGFPLEEIRTLLQSRAISAQRVIALHLERLEAHIAGQQTLVKRLQRVARMLDTATVPPVAALCRIIEATHMIDRHFTTDQLQQLEARRASLGTTRIAEVERDWAELIPAVRAHMAAGTRPDDPELQTLARRWRTLTDAFTGGDPEMAASVRRLYDAEHATLAATHPDTPDPAMFAFMQAVFTAMEDTSR